jgi:hypothetical protein
LAAAVEVLVLYSTLEEIEEPVLVSATASEVSVWEGEG